MLPCHTHIDRPFRLIHSVLRLDHSSSLPLPSLPITPYLPLLTSLSPSPRPFSWRTLEAILHGYRLPRTQLQCRHPRHSQRTVPSACLLPRWIDTFPQPVDTQGRPFIHRCLAANNRRMHLPESQLRAPSALIYSRATTTNAGPLVNSAPTSSQPSTNSGAWSLGHHHDRYQAI